MSKPKQLDLIDYTLETTLAPNIREHRPTDVICHEPSLAQQNFASECDINNILSTWEKTGVLSHENPLKGTYGDLPDVADYQSSLNAVIAAQDAFDSLPSHVRDRFANDPERFLRFMQDPQNADEALRLGLLSPPIDAADAAPIPPSSFGARHKAGAPEGDEGSDRTPPSSKNKPSTEA